MIAAVGDGMCPHGKEDLSLERPLLVGIAGGTSAGKSTFANRIAERIGEKDALVIPESSYYFDRSHFTGKGISSINFDHPDSIDFELLSRHLEDLIDGRPVPRFRYHRDTYVREETGEAVKPKKVILVEGILILAEQAVRDHFDVKIYIDADSDLRFIRRLERDLSEKSIGFEDVRERYLSEVKPMHLRFVEPSKRWADIIVPWGGRNEAAIQMVVSAIQTELHN